MGSFDKVVFEDRSTLQKARSEGCFIREESSMRSFHAESDEGSTYYDKKSPRKDRHILQQTIPEISDDSSHSDECSELEISPQMDKKLTSL